MTDKLIRTPPAEEMSIAISFGIHASTPVWLPTFDLRRSDNSNSVGLNKKARTSIPSTRVEAEGCVKRSKSTTNTALFLAAVRSNQPLRRDSR